MAKHAKQSGNARTRSQRQLRVGEMLRHALVDILQRGHVRDPDLDGISVTIAEVRVSPDMKNATVFCMPLAVEDNMVVLNALNRCAKYLRGQLGQTITMKYTPALKFTLDETFEEAQSIDSLLHSPAVARDLNRDDEDQDGAAS